MSVSSDYFYNRLAEKDREIEQLIRDCAQLSERNQERIKMQALITEMADALRSLALLLDTEKQPVTASRIIKLLQRAEAIQ